MTIIELRASLAAQPADAALEDDTTPRAPFRCFLACWCASAAAYAGILVSRNGQGLQFTDAIAVTFNAKDKALSLGDQPKLAGPVNKLPATHLNGILIRDSDAGVLAQYEQGKAEYLLPQGLPKTAPDDPAAIWTPTSRRRLSWPSSRAAPRNSPVSARTTRRSS